MAAGFCRATTTVMDRGRAENMVAKVLLRLEFLEREFLIGVT